MAGFFCITNRAQRINTINRIKESKVAEFKDKDLSQEEQDVERLDIIKGFPNRDWHDVLAALENPQADHLIEECLKQDMVVLDLVNVIITDGWLPTHVLEVLVPMEFQIKQSHIDLETLKLKLKKEEEQRIIKEQEEIVDDSESS